MKKTTSECYEMHKEERRGVCSIHRGFRMPVRKWMCVLCDLLDNNDMYYHEITPFFKSFQDGKMTREEVEREIVLLVLLKTD